jgi:hypothetical protein
MNKISFIKYLKIIENINDIKDIVNDNELISNLYNFIMMYNGAISKEMAEFKLFKLHLRKVRNVFLFDEYEIKKILYNTDMKVSDIVLDVSFEPDKIFSSVLFCKKYFKKIIELVETNYYDILYKLTGIGDKDIIIEDDNFAFKYDKFVIHIYKIDDEWWYDQLAFNINSFKIMLKSNGIIGERSPIYKYIPIEIKNKIFDVEKLI